VHGRAAGIGHGEVGIQADGLLEVERRPIVVAGMPPNQTASVHRPGRLRIEPDGLLAVRQRPRIVVLAKVGLATAVERRGKIRLAADGLVEVTNRQVVVFLVQISDAAVERRACEIAAGKLPRTNRRRAGANRHVWIRGRVLVAQLDVAALRRKANAADDHNRQDRRRASHGGNHRIG
jgi:hypothetical protein